MKRFVFFISFIVILLTACNSEKTASAISTDVADATASAGSADAAVSAVPVLDCPFTDMSWDSAAEDIIAAEGDRYSTYDSVYGGLCYTYPKEYDGYSGIIKYMFDDNGLLMCVAWTYGSDDADELYELYRSIDADVATMHGTSGYQTDRPDNYGSVWYLESGDIVLSAMLTSENKALQYAYLHPQVSGPAKS